MDMLNAVKSVLADVSSGSPSLEQRGSLCVDVKLSIYHASQSVGRRVWGTLKRKAFDINSYVCTCKILHVSLHAQYL